MPRALSPAQFLALSFGGLIAVGTLLLWLPFSTETRMSLPLVDAFFTSASAVCVTGLIVIDTPNVLSTFGEVVVMVLIAAGGLGYMTFSTLLASMLGRKLSLQERVILQESLNIESREGLVRFALTVFTLALTFEVIGAAILTVWWSRSYELGQSAYLGMFHAVSAFNNAGFSLFSDNLMGFRGDIVVNLVITTLIICGGLGFLVLREVGEVRSFRKLSVHSRFVLSMTAALLVVATLVILGLEWRNPETLGPLGVGEKVLAAYFQAVTPRTAGFNTINIGAMTDAGLFVVIVLMFVGASPGGTGGGVKTTTFGITVLALWATVRGNPEPIVFKRRIAVDIIRRAFFISLIAFLSVNLITMVLLVAEGADLLPTLFETTSAFGTVGLSMGYPDSVLSLVGHFSTVGKLLLTLMMFLGRVGPLTVAIALAGRAERPRVRFPEGKVQIG